MQVHCLFPSKFTLALADRNYRLIGCRWRLNASFAESRPNLRQFYGKGYVPRQDSTEVIQWFRSTDQIVAIHFRSKSNKSTSLSAKSEHLSLRAKISQKALLALSSHALTVMLRMSVEFLVSTSQFFCGTQLSSMHRFLVKSFYVGIMVESHSLGP